MEASPHADSKQHVKSRDLLLGMFSPALFIATDLAAARLHPKYRYRDQPISELSERSAPSRPFASIFIALHNLVVLAVAISAWRTSPQVPAARRSAGFLALGASLATALLVLPLHPRNRQPSPVDIAHGTVTSLAATCIFFAMYFGSRLHGALFRAFTFGCMLVMVVFAGPTSADTLRLFLRRPTPGMGITQRIAVYTYVTWVGALAAATARDRRQRHSPSE